MKTVVRNVKIDDEVHRKLSIRASETKEQKSDLASALILAALENLPIEVIKDYLIIIENDEHMANKKSE